MSKSSGRGKGGHYDVGKGKPPTHTRWRKGVSGNPGGKKKGAINVTRAFETALQRSVMLSIDGQRQPVPALDAVYMRLLDFGLKGDIRAINSILDRSERLLGSVERQEVETSDADLAILQRVLPKHNLKGRGDAVTKKRSGVAGAQETAADDPEGDHD